MAGAVHTDAYRLLRQEIVRVRLEAGMSQAKLAKILGKPASYVAKYELGERRLDPVELCVILKVTSADYELFFLKLYEGSPIRL